MAHRKSFTIIVVTVLLVIPFFCEAVVKRDIETEDSSSGEAEIPRVRERVGYAGSPNVGEEEEQGQDPTAGQGQEEAVEQSTSSSVAAVGKETNHLPLETDEENVDQEHRGEGEESVESTTLTAAPSSAVPLAPNPSEGQEAVHQDSSSHQPQDQQPSREDNLNATPSQPVIIWDGTGEPEREHTEAEKETADQPKHPIGQQDEPTSQPKQPVGQPEEPVSKQEHQFDQTEQPRNQPNQPSSQELHRGVNGNGQSNGPSSHPDDGGKQGHVSDPKSVSDGHNSGSASSSMAWVVVFAVVSSALLISGMGDSEANRESSSCHHGCRHNFADFNPYAWPPTPATPTGITLRPVT